jgi:hypothetical protein
MFHSRLCLLNKGAAHANFSQFWPQTTMATRRNQLNSLLEQMGLGPRDQTLAEVSGGSGTGVMWYAYPLPACCLLIACSGVLVTILVLNEMRLDYSPIRAGFGHKTTEQSSHSRALLRCIVCSHDDAVLVQAELLVPVKCCGSCAKLRARELLNVVRRYARALRTAWFGWVTNVFDYRSNGAALCCALIHQHWWTHPLSIVVAYALAVAVPCAPNGAGRLARCHSFESQTV